MVEAQYPRAPPSTAKKCRDQSFDLIAQQSGSYFLNKNSILHFAFCFLLNIVFKKILKKFLLKLLCDEHVKNHGKI